MNLYDENGFLNFRAIKKLGLPFNFIVGGRGTGKTYSGLKTTVEDGDTFLFMRRTQSQADLINKPEFSPFKALNRDTGWFIGSKQITKYNSGFYHMEQNAETGKFDPVGLPIGYTCALSTISNMRGFDASDCTVMIYDEFIPEKHERPLKHEATAFFNAYETVNRNRELVGRKPLQVFGLANSNDIANPIFIELGLVKKCENMVKRGKEFSIDRERGIGLFLLTESPISEQKRNTALYRLTMDNEFSKMAIENSFLTETKNVVSRNLIEYRPVVSVGEICIYTHKNNAKLYVSTHTSGSPTKFGAGETELDRFRRAYSWIWFEYMANNVDFEEILCEILLTKYLK